MKNHDILVHTSHRPFPLPKGPWLMKQIWTDLLFAHWPVNEAELLPYLPPGLELEYWEGQPWISVAPFRVDLLRLRGLPPLPFVQRFLELNIRTYVVRNGKPGVLFLSMDASNPLAVEAARTIAHLPYHHAEMSAHSEGTAIRYVSQRRSSIGTEAVFNGVYQAVNPSCFHAQTGTLLLWLTERYCLYTFNPKGQLYIGEIHHLPWPLQEAKLHMDTHTSTKSLGLVHAQEPALLTFTKRLDVLFWPFKKA